jgi:hypothetical protein
MSTPPNALPRFDPPANQQDFPEGSPEQRTLYELWNANMVAFIQQAVVNNPWSAEYATDQTSYFNPLEQDMSQAYVQQVDWPPLPHRVTQYLGQGQTPPNPYNWSQEQLYQFADAGTTGSAEYPTIPQNQYLCPQVQWGVDDADKQKFGPWGPRGWMDEYNEFSVVRDSNNKITRVDFTCENPEYWQTLWKISPTTVASVYETTLNWGLGPGAHTISVSVEDLQLVDGSGNPVIDPATGRPAFNPLNKWNSGTVSVRNGDASDYGGAMQLTSTPNTLQTETNLAACGTVQRTSANSGDTQALICCSQYGQEYRNSDPTIGAGTNQLVGQGNIVSLANPVGLYMQMPDFSLFRPPSTSNLPNLSIEDCWQVVRGSESLPGGLPGNFILHAVFQIPSSWIEQNVNFTVGDIEVFLNGEWSPIQYGSQIQQTFLMGLNVCCVPAPVPEAQPCKVNLSDADSLPAPLQLMAADLWTAYYDTAVPNPMGTSMSVASNTVIVPVLVQQGTSARLTLACADVQEGVAVSFPPPSGGAADITVGTPTAPQDVNYATPGNSFPSGAQVITFDITVSETAETGLRSVLLVNPGQQKQSIPMPAFLLVVPPGYLPAG